MVICTAMYTYGYFCGHEINSEAQELQSLAMHFLCLYNAYTQIQII